MSWSDGPLSDDAFGPALQKAEVSVRECDTAPGRRALGGLWFVDDRFKDAQAMGTRFSQVS